MPVAALDGTVPGRASPNVVVAAARDLFPGYFAMVMATGALSIGANLL